MTATLTSHATQRIAERWPDFDADHVARVVVDQAMTGEFVSVTVSGDMVMRCTLAPARYAYAVVAPDQTIKTVLAPGMDFNGPGGRVNLPDDRRASEHVHMHPNVIQGTDAWHAARMGLLTASTMGLVLTPTLKIANNDKVKTHLYELLAQRITNYIEPTYQSDDMLRGHEDEQWTRWAYGKAIAPVEEVGFITNTRHGFAIGYSPDGLVGDDGLIEAKSRRQKHQIRTLVEHVLDGTIPTENVMQCQTGLLVSERSWIDYVSYCGGLHMAVIRVHPDPVILDAIVEAAGDFERTLQEKRAEYEEVLASSATLIPTERRERLEVI